jgi:hypothetical protein
MFTRLYSECTQPPGGYDSVIGEPGGVLNYDEAIGACQPNQYHQGQWTLTVIVDYSVSCECALTPWLTRQAN